MKYLFGNERRKKLQETISIIIAFILIVLVTLTIPIVHDYFEYNNNPFNILIEYINNIRIIGDIAFGLLLVIPWILSIVIYLVITIFYNKYTVKLMNIKIK